MGNASGQQGEDERQWKKYNKIKSEKEHNQQHFFEYIQHFLHKSRN